MPTEPTFTPGDRVSYVYSTKTGASFTATILQLEPERGALLDLDDNGGLIWRPLETLTARYSDDESRTCDRGTFACPVIGQHESCETF